MVKQLRIFNDGKTIKNFRLHQIITNLKFETIFSRQIDTSQEISL